MKLHEAIQCGCVGYDHLQHNELVPGWLRYHKGRTYASCLTMAAFGTGLEESSLMGREQAEIGAIVHAHLQHKFPEIEKPNEEGHSLLQRIIEAEDSGEFDLSMIIYWLEIMDV